MGKNDLNKLVALASQIAEENAYVYGKQIKKNHIDKEIFRPDSFIKLAVAPGIAATSAPVPAPSPSDVGIYKIPQVTEASKSPYKAEVSSSSAAIVFYDLIKSDLSTGSPNPQVLKSLGLDTDGTFEKFWIANRTLLEKSLFTTEYGMATVGPGGRGGEEVRSLFSIGIPKFSVDLTTYPHIAADMSNILQSLRIKILSRAYSSKVSKLKENIQTGFKWWDALSNSLSGNK